MILLQSRFPVTTCSTLTLCLPSLVSCDDGLMGSGVAAVGGCPRCCTRRIVTDGSSGVLFLSSRRMVLTTLDLSVLPSRQLLVLVLTVLSMSVLLFTIETIRALVVLLWFISLWTSVTLSLLGRLRLSSIMCGRSEVVVSCVLASALIVVISCRLGR